MHRDYVMSYALICLTTRGYLGLGPQITFNKTTTTLHPDHRGLFWIYFGYLESLLATRTNWTHWSIVKAGVCVCVLYFSLHMNRLSLIGIGLDTPDIHRR